MITSKLLSDDARHVELDNDPLGAAKATSNAFVSSHGVHNL